MNDLEPQLLAGAPGASSLPTVFLAPEVPLFVAGGEQGPAGPAGGNAMLAVDEFVPTRGQTDFPLSNPPVAFSVTVSVNGQGLHTTLGFTLTGSTVSLSPTLGFVLDSNDSVEIRYQKVPS